MCSLFGQGNIFFGPTILASLRRTTSTYMKESLSRPAVEYDNNVQTFCNDMNINGSAVGCTCVDLPFSLLLRAISGLVLLL